MLGCKCSITDDLQYIQRYLNPLPSTSRVKRPVRNTTADDKTVKSSQPSERKKVQWTQLNTTESYKNWLPEFTKPVGFVPPEDFDKTNATPLSYLELFLTDYFWDHVVVETNRFAKDQKIGEQNGKEFMEISVMELKAFMGLHLAMGLVKRSTIRSYWRSTPLFFATPSFPSIMKKSRFCEIRSALNFSYNEISIPKGFAGYDPLFKVRPLLDLTLFRIRTVLSQFSFSRSWTVYSSWQSITTDLVFEIISQVKG